MMKVRSPWVQSRENSKEGTVRRRLAVLVVMLLTAGAARAQSSPTDQAEQIRILLEKVQNLEKRLGELETKQSAAAAPVPLVAANVAAAPAPVPPEATPT